MRKKKKMMMKMKRKNMYSKSLPAHYPWMAMQDNNPNFLQFLFDLYENKCFIFGTIGMTIEHMNRHWHWTYSASLFITPNCWLSYSPFCILDAFTQWLMISWRWNCRACRERLRRSCLTDYLHWQLIVEISSAAKFIRYSSEKSCSRLCTATR